MNKTVFAIAFGVVAAAASMSLATPTIDVGTKFLIPNTANQVISLSASDPVAAPNTPVQGVDFFAQIGDGSAAGPSFTSATLIAPGLLFATDNTGDQALTLAANGKRMSISTATAGTGPDGNGIVSPSYVNLTSGGASLVNVTVTTVGFSTPGQSFGLSLTSPGSTQFIVNDAVTTTIANGTLKITLPGDADVNGITDFTDLGILLNNYDAAGGWTKGDFDFSNTVDFADLGILLNNYNQSAPLGLSAAANAVPEPATWLMLVVGGASAWCLRRRVRPVR